MMKGILQNSESENTVLGAIKPEPGLLPPIRGDDQHLNTKVVNEILHEPGVTAPISLTPRVKETTMNQLKDLKTAIQSLQTKADAPTARLVVRLNQTQTAEAMRLLKKIGLGMVETGEGELQPIDVETLFLGLLTTASVGLTEVEGDTRADKFVKEILFPVRKVDEVDVVESGKKTSKSRARRKRS